VQTALSFNGMPVKLKAQLNAGLLIAIN